MSKQTKVAPITTVTEYNLKSTSAQVKVIGVERIDNSRNGNPRYKLITDMGTYKTAADAGMSYSVPFNRLAGTQVFLDLNGRGTISDITGEF